VCIVLNFLSLTLSLHIVFYQFHNLNKIFFLLILEIKSIFTRISIRKLFHMMIFLINILQELDKPYFSLLLYVDGLEIIFDSINLNL